MLVAQMNISPSELGIDMRDPNMCGLMLRVHRYIKEKESEAMKSHSNREPKSLLSFKEVDDLL